MFQIHIPKGIKQEIGRIPIVLEILIPVYYWMIPFIELDESRKSAFFKKVSSVECRYLVSTELFYFFVKFTLYG